jgi:hypothetical protein
MLGFYWLRTQDPRARVYRHLGKHADAENIDRDLAKLLERADSDFAIARAVLLRTRIAPPRSGTIH